MNPHEGAVLLEHAGRTAQLRFTWSAIETIRAEWGDDYVKRMDAAMSGPVLPDMAYLIAIIGGMEAEAVTAWSPPIGVSTAAISTAWQRAWFGVEQPEKKGADANPPKALAMLRNLSGLQWLRPSARASDGMSSGS